MYKNILHFPTSGWLLQVLIIKIIIEEDNSKNFFPIETMEMILYTQNKTVYQCFFIYYINTSFYDNHKYYTEINNVDI